MAQTRFDHRSCYQAVNRIFNVTKSIWPPFKCFKWVCNVTNLTSPPRLPSSTHFQRSYSSLSGFLHRLSACAKSRYPDWSSQKRRAMSLVTLPRPLCSICTIMLLVVFVFTRPWQTHSCIKVCPVLCLEALCERTHRYGRSHSRARARPEVPLPRQDSWGLECATCTTSATHYVEALLSHRSVLGASARAIHLLDLGSVRINTSVEALRQRTHRHGRSHSRSRTRPEGLLPQ